MPARRNGLAMKARKTPLPTRCLTLLTAALMGLSASGTASAIEFGQADTFDDGSTSDWVKGGATQLPVENIADGGPDGSGDNFIRNESTGSGNADSRQVFYNQAQWAGDYNAVGVGAITMMANNLGSTTLYLRVAVQGPSATQFGSTNAVVLAPGSGWTYVEFDLTAPSVTAISGPSDLTTVLGSVNTVRIVSAQAGPAWRGDIVDSVVGIDQIRARSSIIPVYENSWGRVKSTFLAQ